MWSSSSGSRSRWLFGALILVLSSSPAAFGSEGVPAFSDAEQTVIARAFAPTLVFHPLEKYLPVIPLDENTAQAAAPGTRAQQLGTPAERARRYEALSLDQKINAAALRYRVFQQTRRRRGEVVVEYWCYYVYNAFTVHGTWFPYRVGDNHRNDLERIYIVLTPTDAAVPITDDESAHRALRIRQVVANAHDGSVPPNTYTASSEEALPAHLMVLVERGSHAMAPDINGDGRFTPGIDSTQKKFLWGIRDHGTLWQPYRASYMDDRQGSLHLCGPGMSTVLAECFEYALEPSGELSEWLGHFNLTRREWQEVVGRTPWRFRAFGNVRIEDLIVPNDPPGRNLASMLTRRSRTEQGFLVGFTTVGHMTPTLILSERLFWDVPAHRAPDIIAEVAAMFPQDHRPAAEGTVLAAYGIDAVTRFVGGATWASGSGSPTPVAGVELRVGHFRVRPTWSLLSGTFDSRVTLLF